MEATDDSIVYVSGCLLHDIGNKGLWDGMGNLAQVNAFETDGQSATHTGSVKPFAPLRS